MTREEAIKELKDLPCYEEDGCGIDCEDCDFQKAINMAIELLKEPKQGEWVLDKEFSFIFNMYECSKCRFNGSKRWQFCPNCGADMRKRGESEC